MKNDYRYFQRGEKTPWIAIPADGAERAARLEDAVRLTVLSTNKMLGGIDSDVMPKDVRFFGPLYFDIDNKEDLKQAIESGITLCNRLIDDYGMDQSDIQVFLSGSKGIHVLIAPTCFGLDRSVVRLPQVYAEMALALYVGGMDLQVYSLRNAMRLPNVKRDDGKYRIQITVEELRGMTVELYQEMTARPRIDFRPPAPLGKLYTQMAALFGASTEYAKRNERPVEETAQVYAPVLRATFQDELPPCIHACADGKVNETKNFNQVAMQVGIFMARLNPDGLGTFKPVMARMADNTASSQYNSARARRDHLEGAYNYVKAAGSRYEFSCNAMRSIMKNRVCDDCPLENAKVIETPADAAKEVGLAMRGDGYFDNSQKGSARRLSTFTLEPQHVFSKVMEDGQIRRVGTVATVRSNGMSLGNVMLEEGSWNNRHKFLQAMQGLGNISYFGSDTDLQKIKYAVMADGDLPEKTMVQEMGLHITKAGDKEIRTYVEKGQSFNSLHIKDNFSFDGEDLYSPFLFNANKVKQGDEQARLALYNLLDLNEPRIMGLLVGWCAACHFKPHLNNLYRQFPPLNLWGNMSTGKTTTAAFAMNLAGVDFITEHEEMNVPVSSPYAWLQSLSNSTSVPVLWDEVNKSADRMPAKMYAKACELLKACWNGQASNKGGLSNTSRGVNVVINTYRMIRPVLYCSEQQPDLPALRDRSLTLMITKAGREGRRQQALDLRDNLDGLKRLAFNLMATALNTPTTTVAERYRAVSKKLPEEISDRQRYGLAVSIMGMQWLREIATASDLMDRPLTAKFDECEMAMMTHAVTLAQEEASRQVSTEVDRAFAEIFEIIDQALQFKEDMPGTHVPLLKSGVNFSITNTVGQAILWLDIRSAHSAYLQHARRKGINVVLDDVRTFITLSQQEDYVEGLHRTEAVLDGRHALRINLTEAQRSGLPVDLLGKDAMSEY